MNTSRESITDNLGSGVNLWSGIMALIIILTGCGEEESGLSGSSATSPDPEKVALIRQAACAQDWDNAARKGSGAEMQNASLLWSVSPYHLLVPATGTGYTRLNIDTPHYDWLIYTTATMSLESLAEPSIRFNGPVEDCPDLNLVEYYVHHEVRTEWYLQLTGEPMSRALFYAGLLETDHSDPNDAGHASHLFNPHETTEEHTHDP